MIFSEVKNFIAENIVKNFIREFNDLRGMYTVYSDGIGRSVKFFYNDNSEHFRLSTLQNNCSTLFISEVSSKRVYDDIIKHIFYYSHFQLILSDFNFDDSINVFDNLYIINFDTVKHKIETSKIKDVKMYWDASKTGRIRYCKPKIDILETKYKLVDSSKELKRNKIIYNGFLYPIFINPSNIVMGKLFGRVYPIDIPEDYITLMTIHCFYPVKIPKNVDFTYEYKSRRTGNRLLLCVWNRLNKKEEK